MNIYSNLSDNQLVSRVIDGDHEATTHLLAQRCGPGLKYLANTKYRTLGVDFRELISEIFLILQKNEWRALRDFRGSNAAGGSCMLSSYVSCIAARFLSRKMSKVMKESACTVPLELIGDESIHNQHAPAEAMALEDVMSAVLQLPDPVDRAVITLYKVQGLPVSEVAKLLNTSVGNVYTRCSRALGALRSSLQEGQIA